MLRDATRRSVRPARAGRLAAVLAAASLGLTLVPDAAAAPRPTPVSPTAAVGAVLPPPAPKNVIVLIGDGMGYSAVDLASAYAHGTTYRQVAVDPATGTVTHAPSTPSQVFEQFPVQVAASTYSASGRHAYDPAAAWGTFGWVASGATDSAAAATALATGTKTVNGRLGIAPDGTVLENLSQRADALGKATGIVTSVPFSHATPAGFAAHEADRTDYVGVTHEYLDAGYLDVVIGAGHPFYDDAHRLRGTPSYGYVSPADWQRLVDGSAGFTLVDERAEFDALAAGTAVPDRVFGAVQVGSTLQQGRPGVATASAPFAAPRNDVPDLATLARGALNVLDRDTDGFFLMVEGGAIDWAGHANTAVASIEETLDLADAVAATVAWVEAESSWSETLVVVTADHETGYLTGPGADPTWTPLTPVPDVVAPHSWHSTGHTNQLVPLYARGAGADALAARATGVDPVRGAYVDNTDVGSVVLDELWPPPPDPLVLYVTRVYRDLFERAPDPVGLEHWTTQLRRGTPRVAVANGITGSEEYRGRLITGVYQEFLGRRPDSAGLAAWLRAMGGGLTIQGLESGFVASAEYYANAGGTYASWVRQLYLDVLGRSASAGEVAAWVRVLTAGGSRSTVALGFLLSTERLSTVVDGYYTALLGRPADPAGRQSWVSAIQRGVRTEDVIGAITASDEYVSSAQQGA